MVYLHSLCLLCLILISSGDKLETYRITLRPGESPYIRVATTISQPIDELSICYWFRAHNRTSNVTMTVLSYALPSRSDELVVGIVTETEVFFHRQLRNKNKSPAISERKLLIGRWHHICATWSSLTGKTNIFINGMQDYAATAYGIALDEAIEPGGTIILGQRQVAFGGGFSIDEGFQGDLSELHIWDYLLCDEIPQIYRCTLNADGNVFSWKKTGKYFYNGVQTSAVILPCDGCQ